MKSKRGWRRIGVGGELISCNNINSSIEGGARGVVVIVVGIGHGDTSSNPGRG